VRRRFGPPPLWQRISLRGSRRQMLRSAVPRAVVFDLDGVLLDTEGLYTEGTSQVVGRFGKTYPFELKVKMMGRSAVDSARILLEELEIPLSVAAYLEERARILMPLFAKSKPMPGAEQLVRWLHAEQIPIAVATSSNRGLFKVKTSHHDWFGLFNVVICGDDPRLKRPKPAPDIFLLAAQELGFHPTECIAVEDSPSGAEAAANSEMELIVVPDPRVDRALLPRDARVEDRLEIAILQERLGIA
jgi:pseudouridine 5'-phosphatase